MLLEQVNSLTRYWGRYPPVHELVANHLGMGCEETPAVRPEITAADLARLTKLTQKWGLA